MGVLYLKGPDAQPALSPFRFPKAESGRHQNNTNTAMVTTTTTISSGRATLTRTRKHGSRDEIKPREPFWPQI